MQSSGCTGMVQVFTFARVEWWNIVQVRMLRRFFKEQLVSETCLYHVQNLWFEAYIFQIAPLCLMNE